MTTDEIRTRAAQIIVWANEPREGMEICELHRQSTAKVALPLAEAYLADPQPIDMVLPCPRCGTLHIDAPEPGTDWDNPPHKSHLCHSCGLIWRPADVPTNGVAAVKTRGSNDIAV